MSITRRDNGTYVAVVDIVKAAACIMIFLYHCNTFLPGEWKFVTIFGQDLGNNLFFMVSGFALAPSIIKTPVKDFIPWYVKRLVRILPITAIAYIAAYINGYYSLSDPVQLLAVFVYPTLYWFITAILVFYIILFFMGKYTGIRTRGFILMILMMLFLVFYARQERLYLIGFYSMLIGFSLRERIDDIPENKGRMIPLLIGCIALFLAGELTEFQMMSEAMIFAGAIGSGAAALIAGYHSNDELTQFFEKRRALSAFIRYVGDMALPLYLVQCFCSGLIGYRIGLTIDFPMSFPVNLVIVWSIGSVLYILEKYICRWYTNSLVKHKK